MGSSGGIDPGLLAGTADLLTAGEETFSRRLATSAAAGPTGSGQLRLSYFTARKSETTTQTTVYTGTTAAGATPTLCRIGLYSVAANGDITLVASTANDTTLFGSTTTAYTRSWSTPYAKVAGQRYAWGPLVVTGAAVPNFVGSNSAIGAVPTTAPRLTGIVGSLADLPASVVAASVGSSSTAIYGEILP